MLDYKKRAEWNKTIYAWFAKYLKEQRNGGKLSIRQKVCKELRRDATQRYRHAVQRYIDS